MRKISLIDLMMVLAIISMLIVILLCPKKASAAEIPEKQAVLAIIGEAENQGQMGMLAVACAIRNRGSLKGIFGMRSSRVVQHKYSKEIYEDALKAWRDSANHDITRGATHWENIKAFGRPYWVNGMIETYVYKDHVFYKEDRSSRRRHDSSRNN